MFLVERQIQTSAFLFKKSLLLESIRTQKSRNRCALGHPFTLRRSLSSSRHASTVVARTRDARNKDGCAWLCSSSSCSTSWRTPSSSTSKSSLTERRRHRTLSLERAITHTHSQRLKSSACSNSKSMRHPMLLSTHARLAFQSFSRFHPTLVSQMPAIDSSCQTVYSSVDCSRC